MTASAERKASDGDGVLPRIVSILIFIVVGAPILALFYGSFRSDAVGVPGAHFSIAHWLEVYGTSLYRRAFFGTLLLSASVGVLAVAVGGVLAWIVARTNAPGRRRIAPLLIVPLMISSLVTALAWIALCAPNAGLFNTAMRGLFGVKTTFDVYSFSGVVLVLVLHFASFAFVPIHAALMSIDGSLEEASHMLGATPLQTAWRMSIRLMLPTLLATGLLVAIFTAENFTVPMLLSGNNGFHSLASQIYYDMTAEPPKPTTAATSGILLLSIALVGTVWQRRITRNARRYVTVGGKGSRPRITDLGRGRYFATGFMLLYLLLAVGLPYFTLILASLMRFVTPQLSWSLFTLKNYTTLLSWEYFLPVRNSILLGTLCGMVATFFYAYVAFMVQRSRGWRGRALDYVVMLPTAMPALVLGVGLSWTYIGLPLPIYGTVWILVIAYFTRFIGQGVRQSGTAILQISAELTEAARMSGASPLRAFGDILLPLLRPSLISLWTILFILIFMEISMTSLLFTDSTMTLPVLLWQSISGGYQTEAFAIAVVQATIVFVILLVVDKLVGVLRQTVPS